MLTTACCCVIRRTSRLLSRLGRRNEGQDLIEYALLTGIIAIAGVLVFPSIRTKMGNAYRDWNDDAQVIWEVPPPL